MKDRIQKLLGSGLSPALVATVVGCDPSYISQLMADEQFAASVATIRCTEIESLKERDGKYDQLEDKFLEKLEHLLPMMLKPRDVLSALQIINNAKRRAEPIISAQPQTVINQTVLLQLPTRIVNTFEQNSKGEIVSIDNKPLAAMPTSLLMKEIQNVTNPPPTTSDASLAKEERLLSPEVRNRIVSESSI